MNSEEKEWTQEEAEEDFKNAVADIFSKKIPGVYRDENGFLVIPRRTQKPNKDNTES